MRLMKHLFLIVTLVSFVQIHAQDDFEGTVKFRMNQGGQETYLDYSVKSKNIKMDIKAEENVSIIFKEDKFLMVMPSQQMYMEYPKSMLDMMMKNNKSKDSEGLNSENFDKYKTGKTKSVLGYNCEQWIYKDENGTSEIWATDELGSFFFAKNPMQRGGTGMLSLFNDTEFFPLSITVVNSAGDTEMLFEATEVSKKKLDKSEFEAPDGFRKMSLPGMK